MSETRNPRALVLVLSLLACGGVAQALTACSQSPGRLATVPPAPVDSSAITRGDPVCGDRWRWTGTQCVETEATGVGQTETASFSTSRESSAGGATTAGRRSSTRAQGESGGDPASEQPGPSSGPQLVVTEVKVGTGAEAKSGDTVRVHYRGTLADGTEFDSSRKRGQPFEFRAGEGQVIKGFDRGVIGMKVGGVRKVHIPYELGYGRRGAPPTIPPRADLDFEIELLDVL